MTKMEIFWRANGLRYHTKVRTFPLWTDTGFGFKFYPEKGDAVRCKVQGESNDVINRDTGEVIGEYDPAFRHIVLSRVPNGGM